MSQMMIFTGATAKGRTQNDDTTADPYDLPSDC